MSYLAIIGRLESRTALHAGSGRDTEITDDLCRRDAAGNTVVPGTALAGALRALAMRIASRVLDEDPCKALLPYNDGKVCGCGVCRLFGELNPSEGDNPDTHGRASRLAVANARPALPARRTPRIRDGVGIDRITRTASRAGRVKFDLEVLPRGTVLELRLELEEASTPEELLLAAVLAEWQAGRAWIGGRTTRGLGAFDLRNIRVVERNCSDVPGLLTFLRSDSPWEGISPVAGWLDQRVAQVRDRAWKSTAKHEGVANNFVIITFDLKADSPFFTNDQVAAVRSGFEKAPLLDVIGQEGRVILPGASLRGALRSHAERIARTLAAIRSANAEEYAGRCSVCDPFGASCDSLLRERGVSDKKEVEDNQLCLACRLFGSTRRGSRLIAEDAFDLGAWSQKVLDFLAIDRFTGGGKTGAKFDAITAWRPSFAVRLYLENPREWELGWLTLVLRDLQEGLLPVGFGKAKGFGRVKMDGYIVQWGFLGDADTPVQKQETAVSGLYRVVEWQSTDSELRGFQQSWVDAFHIIREKPSGPRSSKSDAYFGQPAEQLYGKAMTL